MIQYLTGIGEYLEEDYEDILRISEDRDHLDPNWVDWKIYKENTKKQLLKKGMLVVDIIVRPEELIEYCQRKGVKINGDSRSEFISNKTRELNK